MLTRFSYFRKLSKNVQFRCEWARQPLTRGRQNNCQTIYISQSYFRLPCHIIRENANIIFLFPQDAKNLHHIHADHCDGDLSLDEFKKFCRSVWNSGSHQFVTIDLTSDK